MTVYKNTLVKKITEWEFERTEVYCRKLQWFSNEKGEHFVICHYKNGTQHTFLLDQYELYYYEDLTI